MYSGNRLSYYIWIIILALMLIGFLSSVLYWVFVYGQMGEVLPCGCHILTKNELMYIMIEYKASILGIKPIYLSLIGFPVGAIVSLYALTKSYIYKTVFMVASVSISTTYIPYLIYLLLSHGIFCIYCSIMQGAAISSAILSILDYMIRTKI